MKFRWRRDAIQLDPDVCPEAAQGRRDAQAALRDAQAALEAAHARQPRVDAVALSLAELRTQNHFAERIRLALEDHR